MPLFEYKGLNKAGKNVRGSIDADNARTARARLKKDGIYVVDLKDKSKAAKKGKAKKGGHNKGVSVNDLSILTRQLATLLKANIPLVDSLGAVSDQLENEMLSDVMAEIKNNVNEGAPFHKSMRKYPKIFNKIYVSMCEAGEMSGTLDVILLRLAEFTESQNELNNKLKSAMMYPVLMTVFMLAMLAALFIFVIPKMVMVFDSNPDLVLPWYSVMVIDFSGLLVNYWHVIVATFVVIFVVFRSWKNSPKGRGQWDAVVLKLPTVGKLARMVAVSRFTRTLSTLLTGGVPMLTAMQIVRNVVDNEVLATALDNARENISEGESIAGPLKKSGQFPPIVIHMINIGEKTGELEQMLTQVSDAYDFQVKTEVEGLTSLLTPIMLILMGCVIGVIVFSIMIPVFEMSGLGG
ncbi:MAG: type II secretion system inner membrane protein GspF [Bdellovibrionaceae bacterium]|nr:type II secretion system inner membrane protein GspF [Bdellovibrionales bacterium]MCB9082907.1 type II secretion system inner membrane protein GspF [Pseudobdellovibrionaceae bacterium]